MHKIVVMFLVVVLVGCGTVDKRINSRYKVGEPFAGVKHDKKELSNAWAALLSFGIYPLIHIVSMPIDFGVDLTLYPIDKYKDVQSTKRYNADRAPFQFYNAVGVNLTSYEDFKFKTSLLNDQVPYHTNKTVTTAKDSEYFSLYKTAHIALRKGAINKLQVNWTINTADSYSYKDNPHKRYSDDWYDWQKQYKKSHTFNYQQELIIPVITGEVEPQLLVLLFLPCNHIVVVFEPITVHSIQSYQLVEKLRTREDYQSLVKLEQNNQCPVQ